MSNKQWRKPANPDFKPAVDLSIPVQEPATGATAKGSGPVSQGADAPSKTAPDPGEPDPGARSALSDQEVFDVLDLGAKFLHNFLAHAVDTLSKTGYEQMRRVANETPEPVYDSPQKRPRGRMHSLLLLVKFGIAALALAPRIFQVTHPHLFPAGTEKRSRVKDAAEKFMGMVQKASAVPGAA